MSTSLALIGLGVASLALAIAALILGHRGTRQTRTAVTLSYCGKVITFEGEPTATPKEILQLVAKHIAYEGHSSSSIAPAHAHAAPEKIEPPMPSPEAAEAFPAEAIPLPAERELSVPREPSASSGPDLFGVRRSRRRQRPAKQEFPYGSLNLRNSEIHDDRYAHGVLVGVDLTNSDLDGANFVMADLRSAQMNESSLVDANLSGATLDYASLLRVNFLRANLREASLLRADLTGSNLAGADLREANLDGAIFDIDDLAGAHWDETTVWPVEVRARLYESSTQVVAARGDLPAVFEVASNPEGEEIGAGIRRR